MILLLLACVLILQLILYTVLDRKRSRYGRAVVLLAILILYGFVLPPYFLPDPPEPGEPQCGMPFIAVYGVFWVFGGGITLLTHGIYWFTKRMTDKRSRCNVCMKLNEYQELCTRF